MEVNLLGWDNNDPLKESKLARVCSIADGNCFFHSVIAAFYIPYRKKKIDGKHLDRRKFIAALRYSLAKRLEEKDENGIMIYDKLSRGTLREHSKDMPQITLDFMKMELSSNASVDNIYIELVSDEFNKDIYILDERTRNCYVTGMDFDILYKKRDSIILLYNGYHYDLVARISGDEATTLFSYKDPLIKRIRRNIRNSIKRIR